MRKISLLMFLCLSCLFLSSCWDARELSDIGIVVMTGFDMDDDGLDRVTIMSVQPFGQAQNQENVATTWLGTASGKSAFEALRNLRRTSTRSLTWMHNKIILIGEERAKHGISNITDLLTRNSEFRYDNVVFITPGKAYEMMQVPANLEKSLFRELLGIIEGTGEWSKGFALNVKELSLNSHTTYRHGYVIGNMGFYYTKKTPFTIDYQEYMKLFWKDTEQPIAFVSGGSVIDNDRLIGWLSPAELRGYLILTNNIQESFSIMKSIPESGYEITADITDLKSEILFPVVTDDKIYATVKVKAIGFLTEVQGDVPEYGEAFIEKIGNILADEIASELSLVVKRAQDDLRTDFIGFHKTFSTKYPKYWSKLMNNWCEVFCTIPVSYDVEVKIRHRGLMGRTMQEVSQ